MLALMLEGLVPPYVPRSNYSVNSPLLTRLAGLGRFQQLEATPGYVRLVHAHAEPGAGEVRMIGDESGSQDVGGGIPVKALLQPRQPLSSCRLSEARGVVGRLRVLLLALTKSWGDSIGTTSPSAFTPSSVGRTLRSWSHA